MEVWVIEFMGENPPCWIAERHGAGAAFDVTYQRTLAKKFTNREDASCEMLRLGLSSRWEAMRLVPWTTDIERGVSA